MAKLQQRKCSLCRNIGHNKRTCPDLQTNKTARTSKHVRIHVIPDPTPSNHVVDLGDHKSNIEWHKITAYKEEPKPEAQRVAVNFASLIRAHNQGVEKQISHKESKAVPSVLRERSTGQPLVRKKRTLAFSNPFTGVAQYISSTVEQVFAAATDRLTIKRFTAAGLVLCLLAMLPFPALSYYTQVKDNSQVIIEKSTNAFLALQSSTIAALNANLPQAQYDLSLALESFTQAKGFIDQEHRALFFVAEMLPVIGTHVSSRTHILQAGHHLALGNTYLVKGLEEVGSVEDGTPSQRLTTLKNHITSALPQYEAALEELSGVNPKVLPVEYQGMFDEFKLLYAAFVNDLNDLVQLIDTASAMLGNEGEKRYLVIAQNSNELRATGGFMGSFAIVNIQNGKIVDLSVPWGGTYDVQGQLKAFVKPPVPLQIVNNRWEFQDANWFVDFPASAEKIAWFYEQSWNQDIDGVVAVNSSVLGRVLSVLGPITTSGGVALSQENAIEALRGEIESANQAGSNAPKAVLADGLDAILAQLENAETPELIQLLGQIGEALEQREIQIYSGESNLQETIESFGWGGSIKATLPNQDYLLVASTNIGGGKSDARIEQSITHQALVDPATGEVVNTVMIERAHTGSEDELFYGAANMSYVRVYVPKGATLLEAGGFDFPPEDAFLVPEETFESDVDLLRVEKEIGFDPKTGTRITEEFGKTVFANWMAVGPGESSQAYIVYKLPFTVHTGEIEVSDTNPGKWQQLFAKEEKEYSRYSLFVQKQSGIVSNFSSTILYPESWQPIWSSREDIDLAKNGAVFHDQLKTDQVLGVIFEKN